MQQTVAIIGAGMAGLAAARRLTAAGRRVVLFEKSRGIGGRVATRRVEGCVLDHGAQTLKPDGFALGEAMQRELPTEDLVEISLPILTYVNDGSLLPPEAKYAGERKFAYRNGMTTLPKLLLQALPPEQWELRLERRVGALEETDDGVLLRDEQGQEIGAFGAIVLTPPAPQTAALLAASLMRDEAGTRKRVDALNTVPYSACLTVLLGYAAPVPAPPAYALLAADRSRPLLWLAFEQTKCPERVPNGGAALIAQLGPEVSHERYAAPDAEVLALTLGELRHLFGEVYAQPDWWQVKRWRYSQPRGFAEFEAVNPLESDLRVVVCGDGLRPDNGRVHQAYASGLEAAERLLR